MIAGAWEEPRSLLDWLESPRSDRGLRFLEEDWVRYSYEDLAARVLGTSEALRARGTVTGDVVAVAAAEPLRFVTGFFGTLHAGATPLPVAPPILLGARYVEHVASLLSAAPPRVVVSTPETEPDLRAAIDRAGVTADLLVDAPGLGTAGRADPAPLALLQFTSGSTGRPKPVEVSWANLDANTSLIRRWLELTTDDSVASWLPLYHDMGLIGTFLTAVVSEMDAWIMRPEQFVLRPRQWLECFGRHGVTIASSPNFGYSYAERRVRPEAMAGFDLSRWRVAIVGAERIDPAALRRFLGLAQPFGFRPESFRPAYGLAEATLAVTGHPLGSTPDCITIDWEGLRFDAPVSVRGRRRLDRSPTDDGSSVLVSCGRALHGQQVSIVDSEGQALPPGWLGEIVVEGPCVAAGYRARADEAATRLDQGRLLTGDAGFLVDGEVFVLGRIVDSFTVHGRQVYAERVEAELAEVAGLTLDKCVVVPAQGPERDQVVAVVESPGTGWPDRVVARLRAEVGNALDVVVYAARRNAIPRTTSGKPRRRALRQMLLAGELDADLVFSSAAEPAVPR
jgi:acyl-CoA synthetase (AMP-forming)/AMP-acid ligase II